MPAVTASDTALSADAVARGPSGPRPTFDHVLSADQASPGVRHVLLTASDTARATDNAVQGHHAAFHASAADTARAADFASAGGPRALDLAVSFDRVFSGVPPQFTFDAAFAADAAHVRSPFVHGLAHDAARSFDQAAGIAHHHIAPPPPHVFDIALSRDSVFVRRPGQHVFDTAFASDVVFLRSAQGVTETPLTLIRFATGPISRAPLSIASLRNRLEAAERELRILQHVRYSVGPRDDQDGVPVHGIANAGPMGAADDQHHMAFDEATGEFSPSGPVHAMATALAGANPPGPPYGFVSKVVTGSFIGVIQGGQLQVPFIEGFDHGVLGLIICVGDTERNL